MSYRAVLFLRSYVQPFWYNPCISPVSARGALSATAMFYSATSIVLHTHRCSKPKYRTASMRCVSSTDFHTTNLNKPVRLIQSLCAVCGSNLAGLTLLYTGWAKKVIPLVQCNICTRGIIFWPTLYSAALRGGCCVPPCVADVSIVNCAVYQQFNKRTLLLSLMPTGP